MGPDTLGHILSSCKDHLWSLFKEHHDRVLYQLVCAVAGTLGLTIPKVLRAPRGEIAPGVMGTFAKRLIIDQTSSDREISDRRPDLVVRLRSQRRVIIFEVACAWDPTVTERKNQKRREYQELAADLSHQWPGYRIEAIPVVVGDLGLVNNFRKHLKRSQIFSEAEISVLMRDVQREVLCSAVRFIKRHNNGGSKRRKSLYMAVRKTRNQATKIQEHST